MEGNAPGHHACWRMTGGRRVTPAPFLVAGIVNITPDSFSDGGRCIHPDNALLRVCEIADEGADIVDLGAESTRPGAQNIGGKEEWQRLEPVLERVLSLRAKNAQTMSTLKGPHHRSFAVSIDTFRAETAILALSTGQDGNRVDIVNDISGGLFDPAMDEVLAQFRPGYILGHSPARPDIMQDKPRYANVVDDVLHWFVSRMNTLVKAGLPEECICLDPCIGFGKNPDHNLALCFAVPRFAALGRPLCYGVSRKRFLDHLTERDGITSCSSPSGHCDRNSMTQQLVARLAGAGVAIHRVHQVAETAVTLEEVADTGSAQRPLNDGTTSTQRAL